MSYAPHLTPGRHEVRDGVVSVILVNYKGADDTIACLSFFDEVDWPAEALELIVVDNDSQDGSAETIAAACPHVRVIESGANLGFAGGCNVGVDHATGQYIGFINNDARPGRQWIRAAVDAMADPHVGAVASKVLDWDGERIDFADASMTWFAMGYKREAERLDDGSYDVAKDVLFGTGAAMFVPATLYREVGGFDERFFMFYEDVDLGWRLNLLGYAVRYVPQSLAYHRHHVTMKKFGDYRETYLLERNALLSMVKNYDDDSLARALPAAIPLAVRRGVGRAGADTSAWDDRPGDAGGDATVAKTAMTGVYAVDYLVEQLPTLVESRRELQAARTVADRDLFPLFREAIEPAYPIPSYLAAHAALVDAFGLDSWFLSQPRVLVVTGEPLSDKLAGPAIRAWEIARALGASHPVRLISTAGVDDVTGDGFEVAFASGVGLRPHTDWADVIVFQGFLLEGAGWLTSSDTILVADIYDPMHLEQLEQAKDLGEQGRAEAISAVTGVLNRQLARADYFLCASDKQRDFWVGQLAALGRISPLTVPDGGSLDDLIAVVPFGIQDDDPVQVRHGIRGVVDGIGLDDKVIVWGGGVYNWFDPLTLVRAVGRLATRHPDVRLFFMGMKHPNPGVPDMRIAYETTRLADELGLTGRHVFFNAGWVPYADRANVLLDADVGVSTHFEHVETRFSFRTRILDYLWAGLPIVATTGDSFGNILDEEGIGRGVPPEDVDALEQALEEMLYDEAAAAAAREQVARYAERFRWANVLAPLLDFAAAPRRAPDIALSTPSRTLDVVHPGPPGGLAGVRAYVSLFVRSLREGGATEVARRAKGFVERRLHPERF